MKFFLSKHFAESWQRKVGLEKPMPSSGEISMMIRNAKKITNYKSLLRRNGETYNQLEIYVSREKSLVFFVDPKRQLAVSVDSF